MASLSDTVTHHPVQERAAINIRHLPLLLSLVTISLGLIYLAVIPPWGGPDEPRHYEYVRLLNEKGRLVSWEDANPELEREIIRSMDSVNFWDWGATLWKRAEPGTLPTGFDQIWRSAHELHQPPLAYLLYVLPLKLVESSGITTQLYVMRLVSILLNVVVVLAAYMTGRELFRRDSTLALALPVFVMLLPQHLFLHSTVNPDHLAEAAMAWIFAIIARTFRRGLSLSRIALLVVLLAIGLASKRTTLVGVPILGVAFLVYVFVHWGGNRLSWQAKAARLGITLIVLALLGGLGWFGWNWMTANLPALHDYIVRLFLFLPSEQFPFTLDARIISPEAVPLYQSYLKYLFISTWGHFGWMNITLGVQAYWFFAVLTVAALVGIGVFVVRDLRTRPPETRATLVVFAFSILLQVALVIAGQIRYWDLNWGGDPQGRYLFPSLIPMAIFLLIGLRALVPARWRSAWLGGLTAALFLFNLIALGFFIIPFYRA